MRTLCASTLIGEAFVIGLAGLVAMNLSGYPAGTVWAVCGSAMVLCVVLCGALGRPGGIAVGWLLQAGLVVSGLVVPMMYVLGVGFAGLWWAAVHFGGRIDVAKRENAERAAAAAPSAG